MFKLLIKRIKELQGEKSVSALARYLEMPQKTVDTYINGDRKPSVEFIMRVCSKFKVSSDWLLGLTDLRAPFIEVPRKNNLSKTQETNEKFHSFGGRLCCSVGQYYKLYHKQELKARHGYAERGCEDRGVEFAP